MCEIPQANLCYLVVDNNIPKDTCPLSIQLIGQEQKKNVTT